MSNPDLSQDRERGEPFFAARLALCSLGILDCLAILAVVAPREVLAKIHALCGMGELPDEPIVGYLIRSGSLLYALHGAIVLFLATDPRRYLPLIRFMGYAALGHGVAMFLIDQFEAMPLWWKCAEGPGFAATGAVVLWSLPRQPIKANAV